MIISKYSKPAAYLFLIFLIIYAGFCLRSYLPGKFNDIRADEVAWVLAGHSLYNKGTPESWTIFESTYSQKRKILFSNTDYNVVSPWMDHPPLFALFAARPIFNSSLNEKVDWIALRRPMLWFSILLLLSIAVLGWQLDGYRGSILLSVAFSFLPSAALTARMLTPENLFALFIVLALNLLLLYEKKSENYPILLLLMLSFIAPLLKLSGIVIGLIGFGFLASIRKYKLGLLCLFVSACGVGSYFIYGFSYDLRVFVDLQFAHSLRPQSLLHFWSIFFNLNIGNREFFDPAIIAGMLGAFLSLGRNTELSKVVLIYLSVVLLEFLFIAPREFYGWYKYIAYPLIALGLYQLYLDFLEFRPAAIIIFFALLLGTMDLISIQSFIPHKIAIFLAIIALVLFLFLKNKSPKVQKALSYLLITILLISQYAVVIHELLIYPS